MVSPMREKRTWPPKEKDADSAESAAFEATVAVVKETVVRSGEVLVSAKEDLSDHKRWLEAQRAAVLADRARHERWLQKQKEKQEALERRERARRRRRLMRANAIRAVEDAAFAVLDFFISLFWRCVWKVKALLAAARDALWRGLSWLGARLRDLGSSLARLAGLAAAATAAKARAVGGSAGRALSAAVFAIAARLGEFARSARAGLGAAGAAVAAKSGMLARSTGSALSAARSSIAAGSADTAKAAGLRSGIGGSPRPEAPADGQEPTLPASGPAPAGAEIISFETRARLSPATEAAGFAEPSGPLATEGDAAAAAEIVPLPEHPGVLEGAQGLGASPAAAFAARLAPAFAVAIGAVRASVERLARLILAVSAMAARLAKAASERASAAAGAASAKLHEAAPQLHGAINRGAALMRLYAGKASAGAEALLARIKPSPSGAENEVSSPGAPSALAGLRVRGYELSQMLVVSGIVLLVCGGLLLGSGLLLRGGAGSVASLAEKPPSPHAVEWFFEEPELPIAERSVFSAELTPQGVRLTGLAIKAENNSDDALSGIEGVVKPDLKRGDLKLTVKIDMVPAESPHGAEAADGQANDTVPAHAFFSLVVPFPPEAQGEDPGIALDDFIAAYGGLLLKLRYEVAGTQRSLIHYLSPEMLKAQLAEIQHEAKGS